MPTRKKSKQPTASRLMAPHHFKNPTVLAAVTVSILAGVYIVARILAANVTGFEAEGSLSGNVALRADSSASGGQFILFGATNGGITPPPVAPPPPVVTPPPPPPSSGGTVVRKCAQSIPGGATYVSNGGDLAGAISGMGNGQTLVVNAGTYSFAAVTVSASNVTICGAPGARPKIQQSASANDYMFNVSGQNVRIEGFEMSGDGTGDDTVGVSQIGGGRGLYIWDNWIHGFGLSGIDICGTCGGGLGHIDVRYNRIYDNSHRSGYNGSAVSMLNISGGNEAPEADGYHNHIISNLLYGNYASKPFVQAPEQGITDGNGIIFGPNEAGYTGSTLIQNNLVVNNGGQGIQALTFPNVTSLNNSLYHNIANLTDKSAGAELSYPFWAPFGPLPGGCVAHNNAIEPSPGLTPILNQCGSSDISNNATGSGLFVSPNLNNPEAGNWNTIGSAVGKGAPWPLW